MTAGKDRQLKINVVKEKLYPMEKCMNRKMILDIVEKETPEEITERIFELYNCIKVRHLSLNELKKEFSDEVWYLKAESEVGESGINFLYFVAGYLCAEDK